MEPSSLCHAGFAQADITPDFPVELIGCYREDSAAGGVLHPLAAQALAWEFQGRRGCLVAIDSLGLTTALSDAVRERVAERLHTDASQVMLNFSHTHSAPAPLSPLNGQRYFELLCERVVACAAEAFDRRRPCAVGWSVGETDIAENRREGCAVTDRRLGALGIEDAGNGQPIALVLRVSAHANILMTENDRISSDYFGRAREKIAANLQTPVMLLQGGAGNLKPTGVPTIRGGTVQDVERISDRLLEAAGKLRFETRPVERLAMYEEELELYSDVPPEDEAQSIAEEAQRLFGIDGASWLCECERLRSAGIRRQAQKSSVQYLFVNEGCLCGVPDEIFCEISLQVAEQAHSPLLFFNGYTNGCAGYLPHAEEWVKGGYETLYSYLTYYVFHGHVLPFERDTARRLVERVVRQYGKTAAPQSEGRRLERTVD